MEAYRVRVMDDNGKLAGRRPEGPPGIDHRSGRFYPPLQSEECSSGSHQLEGHRQQRELQQPAGGDDHEPHPLHSRVLLRQRHDDDYNNKIKTLRWPTAPDGETFTLRVSVHTGFIPKDSKNKEMAKDFVRFLLEPENLTHFVKASNGAWFPVQKESLKDPFFVSADPHRAAAYKNFMEVPNRPYEQVFNRKFVTGSNGKPLWPGLRTGPRGQLGCGQSGGRVDRPHEADSWED